MSTGGTLEAAIVMLTMNVLRTVSLFALASAALSAHATVLDFEELTGYDGNISTRFGTLVTSQSYVLSTSGSGPINNGFNAFRPKANPADYLYTGSIALLDDSPGSFVTLTHSGGGLFDLQSIDLANIAQQNAFSGGATVGFVGTRLDGTTVSRTFQLQSVDALQTFAFSGFTGLTSVTFGAQVIPFYQFDNVVLSPSATFAVPGPMAALAFGGRLIRRRKRA